MCSAAVSQGSIQDDRDQRNEVCAQPVRTRRFRLKSAERFEELAAGIRQLQNTKNFFEGRKRLLRERIGLKANPPHLLEKRVEFLVSLSRPGALLVLEDFGVLSEEASLNGSSVSG